MFFNSKKKAEEAPAPVVTPAVPEAPEKKEEPKEERKSLAPTDTTVIGKGIVFRGNFTGDDPIVINGSIRGDIKTTSSLTISEDGSYTGNAQVADLESNGRIRGNINCENLSVLGERSTMKGNLVTSYLTSKSGSTFIGQLDMTNPQTPEDDAEEEEAPAPSFPNTGFAGFTASKKIEPVEFDWHPEETARRNAKIAEENARLAEEAKAQAEAEAAKAAEEAEDDIITVDSLLKDQAEEAASETLQAAEAETAEAAEAVLDMAGEAAQQAAEGLEEAKEEAARTFEEMKDQFYAAVEKHAGREEAQSGAPNPFLDLNNDLVGDIKIPDIFAIPEEKKE